jgi:penicillin-binding protein 1A
VTLTQALSMSLNTVAVRLGLEVGAANVVRTAHRLGIASKLEPNASIALGTSEVSLTELVGAYVPFANGGQGITPHVVLKIRTAAGKILYAHSPDPLGQVIEPRNVAAMNTMMQETLISGTAHKAELPGWMAAGKTGTSQDFRDAWFIGYTGHLVTGVWLGNDDNSPTRKATGGGLPVEIWSRFMRAAHQGVPIAALPNSQTPGFFTGVAQVAPASGGLQLGPQVTASQITAPASSPASASLAPLPPAGGYRAPPARASSSARPEAAAGLDGWLIQRLFGGR